MGAGAGNILYYLGNYYYIILYYIILYIGNYYIILLGGGRWGRATCGSLMHCIDKNNPIRIVQVVYQNALCPRMTEIRNINAKLAVFNIMLDVIYIIYTINI